MDARYARLFLSMSYQEALGILGLSGEPSDAEINKAYRARIIQNKGLHPDVGGGDDTELVELNVAKDTLLGKLQGRGYDRSSPTPDAPGGGGGGVRYEKPPPEVVTFEQAKDKAGIPAGVNWMFVAEASSGYSSDEFHRRAHGYVFYGQTDQKHIFVVAENLSKDTFFIGGEGKVDIWEMREFDYPKKEGETLQPAWLYGNVVKGFKMFKYVEKRFNSKVRPLPEGWHLSEKFTGIGKETSIKHWLVNQGLVSGEDPSVVTRKNVVELKYKHTGLGDNEKEWFILTINGKDYELNAHDTKLFMTPSRYRGVATLVFGDYFYDDSKKVLTRIPNPKKQKLFTWMSKNLTGLPPAAKAVIDAEAAPKP